MRTQIDKRRGGTTTVEFAMVVLVVMLFFFGMFEYGRLLAVRQVSEAAARAGARYAVVNTALGSNLTSNTVTQVQKILAPFDTQYNNGAGPTISVYQCDKNGTNLGAPENAAFGQYIAVEISGNLVALLPSISSLYGLTSAPIDVRAVMASEAN